MLERFAGAFSELDLIRFYDALNTTEEELRQHPRPHTHLEIALVKLIEAGPTSRAGGGDHSTQGRSGTGDRRGAVQSPVCSGRREKYASRFPGFRSDSGLDSETFASLSRTRTESRARGPRSPSLGCFEFQIAGRVDGSVAEGSAGQAFQLVAACPADSVGSGSTRDYLCSRRELPCIDHRPGRPAPSFSGDVC